MLATRFLRPVLAAFTSLLAALSCAHAAPVVSRRHRKRPERDGVGRRIHGQGRVHARMGRIFETRGRGSLHVKTDRSQPLYISRVLAPLLDFLANRIYDQRGLKKASKLSALNNFKNTINTYTIFRADFRKGGRQSAYT